MRRVILAICATAAALVLLLSFKTHTQSRLGSVPAAALGSPAPGAAGGTAAASAAPGATRTATAGPASQGTASQDTASQDTVRTVTGDAVQTIYGPVQLQVTLKAGKITGIKILQYPDGTPRDYEINSYAIPQLNSEALAASSANIDMVSGATYTSQGYIGSLQSALDKAKGA